MKVVFLKVEDPIAFKKPDVDFFKDDTDLFVLNVIRVAGILIHETDTLISIGEVTLLEDNPAYKDFSDAFPKYRYVMTISKKNILERQDFEVK